ncbi:MAG: hypothetical protein ACKO43_03760, partial [Alphaproteobacteria bacterium]
KRFLFSLKEGFITFLRRHLSQLVKLAILFLVVLWTLSALLGLPWEISAAISALVVLSCATIF